MSMKIAKSFTCACGANRIELHFQNGMPSEVVDQVYCPICRETGLAAGASFPIAGGWFLHFNLDIAKMFAMARLNIDPALVNPGFLIDNHYVE